VHHFPDVDGSPDARDGVGAAIGRPEAGRSRERKADHLRINLTEDVHGKGVASGFEGWRFEHVALPEMALSDVTVRTRLCGRILRAPVLISCMTGGVDRARRLNLTLAEVAQAQGLAMGVGSGRVLLEDPTVLDTFDVRGVAPDVPLLANLGAVQLNRGLGVDDCRRLLEMLGADALVLHLNPLQEGLQPGGDTDFSGLLRRIETVCRGLGAPVILKEVGWGIAPDLVRRLAEAGVAAVDVAGAGGTSWSEVERHRQRDPVRARVAASFAGWGIPTAEAIRAARAVAPDVCLIASGGLEGGMDVAKAIALGADVAALAGPFLRAASRGPAAAHDLAREIIETLHLAMFCVGARTLAELRGTPRLKPANGSGAEALS
jgi:isopentenyl-diphosphate delta-isomerase